MFGRPGDEESEEEKKGVVETDMMERRGEEKRREEKRREERIGEERRGEEWRGEDNLGKVFGRTEKQGVRRAKQEMGMGARMKGGTKKKKKKKEHPLRSDFFSSNSRIILYRSRIYINCYS